MSRKQLMRAIALATGLSFASGAAVPTALAHHKNDHQAQGYIKSGNPMAAGGPDNPGNGNPHAYTG